MSGKPRALFESRLAIEPRILEYGLELINFGSNMGTDLQFTGIGENTIIAMCKDVGLIAMPNRSQEGRNRKAPTYPRG